MQNPHNWFMLSPWEVIANPMLQLALYDRVSQLGEPGSCKHMQEMMIQYCMAGCIIKRVQADVLSVMYCGLQWFAVQQLAAY